MSEEFRISYCKLWLSVVENDIPKIEEQCRELDIIEHWHFFISMLTLRAWNSKEEIQTSTASKDDMQMYAQLYFKEISETLADMPREFVLIFKTRDCLSALNDRLGVNHDPDLFVAPYCVNAIHTQISEDAPLISWTWHQLKMSWLRTYYYLRLVAFKS